MDVPLDELWYAFFKKSDDVYWYWMVLVCCIFDFDYMDVSKNRGTPKSSILIGFSIINHPFWGTHNFGIYTC